MLDPKAQHYSIGFPGGYISATQGLLETVWGTNFLDKAGQGKTKTVNVKTYTRYRVIGGGPRVVGNHSFTLTRYPHKLMGGPAGGQEIKIKVGTSYWTARMGGSIQNFKAWLLGAGKPQAEFLWVSEKGAVYSSAAKI